MSKDESPPPSAPTSSDTSVSYYVKQHTNSDVPRDLFKLCRGITRELANASISKPDAMIFVLYRNDIPVGFATVYDFGERRKRTDQEAGIQLDKLPPAWRVYDTTTYIIDIFCTALNEEGFGTRILKAIEEYARSIGKTRLELLSVPEAVKFYTKNGFKPRDDSGYVLEKIIGGRRRHQTRRKRRVTRRRL